MLDHHARDLAALPRLRWLGYLSTTGVYGDRGGGWVDESDARLPSGVRGRRRVAAEDGWLALHRDRGLPVHVFRLAGIYGPGRNALATVRAGTARRVDKPGQVFSRIHVDDIVAVLRASMARPAPGAVYNVADDDPAPPQDVVAYAAELLGVAPPPLVPFAEAALSPMARSFYDDSKRVRNDRIKRELGVRLAYPDYPRGPARAARQRKLGRSAPAHLVDDGCEPREILVRRQAMVAVLDQDDLDVARGEAVGEPERRSATARRDRACRGSGAPGRRGRSARAAGDAAGRPRSASS